MVGIMISPGFSAENDKNTRKLKFHCETPRSFLPKWIQNFIFWISNDLRSGSFQCKVSMKRMLRLTLLPKDPTAYVALPLLFAASRLRKKSLLLDKLRKLQSKNTESLTHFKHIESDTVSGKAGGDILPSERSLHSAYDNVWIHFKRILQ